MNTKTKSVRLLSELKTGDQGVIIRVSGQGAFRKRITEMGFVKGKLVTVVKNAPLQDPVEYRIMDYEVSLRRSEANLIEVATIKDSSYINSTEFKGTIDDNRLKTNDNAAHGSAIKIAFVGNPNCGKTTLFNFASGSRERVGNYSGVTVDAKEATFKYNNRDFIVVDLPGTYSITEYSPEELYVREYLTNNKPDIVVNVIDASNLERNLFLTTQLIDMNIKVIIALNMYDELENSGAKFDYDKLAKMIGIPIVPTVGSKGKGIAELFAKAEQVYANLDPVVRHIHINYGPEIESAIDHIKKSIKANIKVRTQESPRYLAIKLLEEDQATLSTLKRLGNTLAIEHCVQNQIQILEKQYNEKSETIIADSKYGFIAGALKATFENGVEVRRRRSADIDSILTHRFLGFPFFILFMWAMFQATFTIGSYPMHWIDSGVQLLNDYMHNIMTDGPLKDLVIDGILGGVGGVIIFLPNILILFFCISLMEDTGYMARASFIMDKLMQKIGLHGKSFIPLIMGFGCNVPAVMATRTLDNYKDRILTMIITPFMSCSARLPVYVLLISAFFPQNQGLILFSVYLTGIVLAILVGLIFKNTLFAKKNVPFVMELPPYRTPTLRNTAIHMWHKGEQYLKKMGGVILVASILIWALGYYPQNTVYSINYDAKIEAIKIDTTLSVQAQNNAIANLKMHQQNEKQEQSYIGRMGKAIEPVIKPLGFDWKIGVCIITGLAAKEIVVSTMGVLYLDGAEGENSATLVDKLKNEKYKTGKLEGKKVFTPLVALALMLFVLIYFPCIAVIAAIKKEGNWRWALFTMTYTTILAYFIALATYQIGSLFV